MTTPASRLREILSALLNDQSLMVPLRTETGALLEHVPVSHAYALAVQGIVEGVHSQSGRLKYLRHLSAEVAAQARKAADQAKTEVDAGKSTAFAVPHIGVFREALGHRENATGEMHDLAEAPTTGYCYTFALLCGSRLQQHEEFRAPLGVRP